MVHLRARVKKAEERPEAPYGTPHSGRQEQLLSDKKAEEEMYDKLSCWCKVNGDGKQAATEIAEAQIASLASHQPPQPSPFQYC